MTSEHLTDDSRYLRRALDVAIHIGLVILLVIACLWIVRPFIPLALATIGPAVSAEVRNLIRQMSLADPRWVARRLHGELLKIGIEVSQATVAK